MRWGQSKGRGVIDSEELRGRSGKIKGMDKIVYHDHGQSEKIARDVANITQITRCGGDLRQLQLASMLDKCGGLDKAPPVYFDTMAIAPRLVTAHCGWSRMCSPVPTTWKVHINAINSSLPKSPVLCSCALAIRFPHLCLFVVIITLIYIIYINQSILLNYF